MSSRRQKLLARLNWYLQSSLKHITGKTCFIKTVPCMPHRLLAGGWLKKPFEHHLHERPQTADGIASVMSHSRRPRGGKTHVLAHQHPSQRQGSSSLHGGGVGHHGRRQEWEIQEVTGQMNHLEWTQMKCWVLGLYLPSVSGWLKFIVA